MEGMRISQVIIERLFGMFDHVINLRLSENITIIHGPNGVGKTTILKLIKDVFDKNFYRLQTYPFERMTIHFNEGTKIAISKKQVKEEGSLKVSFVSQGKTRSFDVPDLSRDVIRRIPPHIIDEVLPFVDRVGPDKWIDRNSNELMTLPDLIYRYKDELPQSLLHAEKQLAIPDEFTQTLSAIPVHFIQTQRLFVNPDPQDLRHSPTRRLKQTTIENYSSQMTLLIREAIRASGSASASLDRTFPSRLLTGRMPEDASELNIREKYKSQNDFRKRLMSAGLIEAEDPVSLPERTLDRNDLRVLYFYLSDVDEKFKSYADLLPKIELFKEIINSRFLYKTLQIDKNEGFLFSSEIQEKIPLKALSSGEQHEAVLAFELIFRVPKNSLILIDEPELSLHVTWQHKFLDDLLRISNLGKLDFLIATHSPSIVQDKRSLMEIIPSEAGSGKVDHS